MQQPSLLTFGRRLREQQMRRDHHPTQIRRDLGNNRVV